MITSRNFPRNLLPGVPANQRLQFLRDSVVWLSMHEWALAQSVAAESASTDAMTKRLSQLPPKGPRSRNRSVRGARDPRRIRKSEGKSLVEQSIASRNVREDRQP